jgi:hypothetical protein
MCPLLNAACQVWILHFVLECGFALLRLRFHCAERCLHALPADSFALWLVHPMFPQRLLGQTPINGIDNAHPIQICLDVRCGLG